MSDHMKRPEIVLPPLRRGATVQAAPGSALWRTGARFGQVVSVRRSQALVAVERGRRAWVSLNSILEA
jgi:hypothetical protein